MGIKSNPEESASKMSKTEAKETDEGFSAELDEKSQIRLGELLARYSDALVNQPVPDIFVSLLAKLQAKELDEE